MPISISAAVILATAALVQTAYAQTRMHPSRLPTSAIVGHYDYRDDELVGSIELRADRTFEYKLDHVGPAVADEEPMHMLLQGVWRFVDEDVVDDNVIALTNAPTTPPVLRQTSAVRDAKVRAAFTIVATDGKPVEDLDVSEDEFGNSPSYALSEGNWTLPLYNEWDTNDGKEGQPTKLPTGWDIMRSSDNLSLLKIALSPGGPNRFTFSYARSPIEPFKLGAVFDKDEPGTVDVIVGTGSLKMHRTVPR